MLVISEKNSFIIRAEQDVQIINQVIDIPIKTNLIILNQLRDLGCQVLPLETLSYAILGSARHTNFKKVSSLIRNRSSNNC